LDLGEPRGVEVAAWDGDSHQHRPVGRPRNPELDRAILAAAEQQLGEPGYARMSLESVAAAAGTTVPSVRRRFGSKAAPRRSGHQVATRRGLARSRRAAQGTCPGDPRELPPQPAQRRGDGSPRNAARRRAPPPGLL